MDVKVRVDGSAKPLTSNPLPRNFNYKIITKIQELNGMNSDNRPLDKLEENAVVLKDLRYYEKCATAVLSNGLQPSKPSPFSIFSTSPILIKIVAPFFSSSWGGGGVLGLSEVNFSRSPL